MKIKYFFSFTLFFSILFFNNIGEVCTAQNKNIDSILTLLKTDTPDTNKVNHLNKLSREYINIGKYAIGLSYCNKALALARSIPIKNKGGWWTGIAESSNNIGIIYCYEGKYTEALKNHLSSLEVYSRIGDLFEIANTNKYIGNIYYAQSNYPEALKKYFASLKIKESFNDKPGIADLYNSIGVIYNKIHKYPEALKNHFIALKIKEEIGDEKSIANSYNNIGNIYKNQNKIPEALNYLSNSLDIMKRLKNEEGVAKAHINLGSIYYEQGNYSKALDSYNSSLKIRERTGDKKGISISLTNIGYAYFKLNRLSEAKNYFTKGLKSGFEINSVVDIKQNYSGLEQTDSLLGNWKSAYQHHKLFIVYRDSIDNEITRKKTTEIILTNKFEKQEAATKAEQDKKDTIATANKKRQQLILILVSSVLILVFIFSGFVVRSLRITRTQKKTIELQKNEVSLQKEIVLEKNKEITDSIYYAQRIQHALLASKKMLDANLYKSNSGLISESQDTRKQIQKDGDYFIFFQPKDIVSGDFYWASPLANGNFTLVTADSTGHGVPGAIMSMLNISCLNEAIKGQQLTEPNEILNYTRSKIIEHLSNDGSADGGKDGMDCSLISFDFNHKSSIKENFGGRLTYSAANNPIWIVRKKQIIELEPDKMPVGKHTKDSIPFTQHTTELEKGDMVYAITDGMPDQFGGPKGKKFMSKQLKELLVSISHLQMPEQKEKLSDEFNLWKGNLEQVDDVTIIGIRI